MHNFFRVLPGLGLMVGTIIGAGMFALPYAVMRAGVGWGAIHLIVAFFLVTLIHLFYSEVIFGTAGTHRLPGYVRVHAGSVAGSLATISQVSGFYGSLLVYGLLGGMFLSRIVPQGSMEARDLTVIFFVAGALLLLGAIRWLGEINFVLSAALALFVIFLVWISYPHIEIASMPLFVNEYWFLPYGVFLFSFAGASVVPDVVDLFQKKNAPTIRRVIVWSGIIPLLIYVVFIGAVVGVSGAATSPEAIFGLRPALGDTAVYLGSIIGFLAVFTSFISLGLDMKNLYHYDFNIPFGIAWAAVVTVPAVLFLMGVSDFISIIGLVGAVTIGMDGIFILYMARQQCGENGACRIGSFHLPTAVPLMLMVALGAGVLYEVVLLVRRF